MIITMSNNVIQYYITAINVQCCKAISRVVVQRGPKKPYRHLGPYPCHYSQLKSVYKKHEHLYVQIKIDAIFIRKQ